MSDTKKLEIAMKWLEDIEGVKSPISALASAALSEIRAVDDQYPLGVSIPSSAEERYRDIAEDIAKSYDIELRSLVNRLLNANDHYAADAVEKLADRMKSKCTEALSPSGEQPKPKQRCPRCGNTGIHYCRPKEEDGE